MDGMGQSVSTDRSVAEHGIILARCVLCCSAFLLVSLSSVLLWRSADDQFAPLQPTLLLSFLVGFLLIVDVWRYAIRRAGLVSLLCDAVATLSLVLLTSAISVNGTQPWALITAWSSLAVHELIVYVAPRLGTLRRIAARSFRARNSRRPGPLTEPTVTQRLLRWSEDGADVVLAEFHCTFEPHERQQPIHIVFCPPLLRSPTITSERLSGPPVTLKTSQCYTFGARLDVRLASAATSATNVVVRVTARAPNS